MHDKTSNRPEITYLVENVGLISMNLFIVFMHLSWFGYSYFWCRDINVLIIGCYLESTNIILYMYYINFLKYEHSWGALVAL